MSTKSSSVIGSPRVLLDRIAKLVSSIAGLDASLMLVQYSSPLVIAVLLRLAKFRAAHPRVRFGLGKGGIPVQGGEAGLVKLAAGLGKAAVSIGDARVIMRAFGLLPVLQGLLRLYPNPIGSLFSLPAHLQRPTSLLGPRTLPTMQIIALLGYYPLEHLAWLASKGLVQMSPFAAGATMLFAVRFWAAYVMLELLKLHQKYQSLRSRSQKLRLSKPPISTAESEGFELRETSERAPTVDPVQVEEKRASLQDWDTWKKAIVVNSGYAPLTLHWSRIGGLWTNPLYTAVFGSIAATGQLMTQWQKGAA